MPLSGDYDGSIVSVLEELRMTADLEGLAILDLSPDSIDSPVVYCLGESGAATAAIGQALLTRNPKRPAHTVAPDGRPLLACPWTLPPNRPGGLLMWRGLGATAWAASDHELAASLAMMLRIAIGASVGQPGVDRLTGLPNRRWFLDEADRHIDRLDKDVSVGTLILLDIDDLRGLNLRGRTRRRATACWSAWPASCAPCSVPATSSRGWARMSSPSGSMAWTT